MLENIVSPYSDWSLFILCLAQEVTETTRQRGKGFEFLYSVFEKLYGKGQYISQWNVLRAAAEEVTLDAEQMQWLVEAGTYPDVVQLEVNQAYQIGMSGVPNLCFERSLRQQLAYSLIRFSSRLWSDWLLRLKIKNDRRFK